MTSSPRVCSFVMSDCHRNPVWHFMTFMNGFSKYPLGERKDALGSFDLLYSVISI